MAKSENFSEVLRGYAFQIDSYLTGRYDDVDLTNDDLEDIAECLYKASDMINLLEIRKQSFINFANEAQRYADEMEKYVD